MLLPHEVSRLNDEEIAVYVTKLELEMGAVRVQVAQALRLAKEATNGWACYAKRKIERDHIVRLYQEINAVELGTRP